MPIKMCNYGKCTGFHTGPGCGCECHKEKAMSEKGKFWMVYCEGGHNPTISHRTVMDAYSEAKRVSSKENKRVFVLEAIGGFEIPNVEPTLFEVKR